MNNSVYGKCMENMRNRIKLRVTTNEKDFVKYVSRPTFVSRKILGKDFVVIHKKQKEVRLNKPIYEGAAVLDLSKLVMYKFSREFINKKCKNTNLLYMDTDSFIFEIIGEDFK